MAVLHEAYLEERARRPPAARERFEEYANTKADLVSRAPAEREWIPSNAMKKNPDNDKIRRAAGTESSESGPEGPAVSAASPG